MQNEITKQEWIDRCFRRYLSLGITNEAKAKLWAESSFGRLSEVLTSEQSAEIDLDLVE